jgi:hypothetical protein
MMVLLIGLTTITHGGTMKNPLDSLTQTVVLGFVLTVIMVLVIHAISA